MDNLQSDSFPEQFSKDPGLNLRIENEILQLKLKAELGGDLVVNSQLPPELENEFLKNIFKFEHAYADARQIKVYDLLGKPAFKKAEDLDDHDLDVALERITALLQKKNIVVEYSGTYENRVKYKFVTEELFEHETDDLQIPGMVMHFPYEEFHPNHKLDIGSKAMDFLSDWFEQTVSEFSWWMGDTFILVDGAVLSREKVLAKIQTTLEAYTAFTDHNYKLYDINFELNEQNETGMGYAEGVVKYTAVLESGEHIFIEGPFKFYMSLEYQCWSIFYFVFPGFNWD